MTQLSFFDDQGWREDARFPHTDWQYEVENGDTRLGYMEWVVAQYEANNFPYTLEHPIQEEASVSFHDQTHYPKENWEEEVAHLDTRLSYAQWVVSQKERD